MLFEVVALFAVGLIAARNARVRLASDELGVDGGGSVVMMDSRSWSVAKKMKKALNCFVSSLILSLSWSSTELSSSARRRSSERCSGSKRASKRRIARHCFLWCSKSAVVVAMITVEKGEAV